jgi:hypothetical protein
MEKRITIVSALFYIGRDRWKTNGFGINNDRYKNWLHNGLSLDTEMIMFCDDHYYEYILETKRKYYPDLGKLTLIKTSIDELEIYQKYYSKISCLMKSPEFLKDISTKSKSAELWYALYNIVMYNKPSLIKRAAEFNPYNATHFFWADAGAFRNELKEYQNVKWPDTNSNIFNDKITFFSHMGSEFSINDQKEYFMSQFRAIQGGYFSVPIQRVDFLHSKTIEVIEEIISANYIGSDEKAFDLISKRYPENIDLIKSTWFEFYKICK